MSIAKKSGAGHTKDFLLLPVDFIELELVNATLILKPNSGN
jgi:hypothetical protein